MSETVGYMQTTACALCGTTARAFVERYFYADETRAKFVVTLEHRGVKRATGCEACFRKAMQDEAAPSPSAAHAALLAEAERAIAHTHHRCTTPTMHAMTNEPSLDDPGTRSIDCIVADLAAALRSASPSPGAVEADTERVVRVAVRCFTHDGHGQTLPSTFEAHVREALAWNDGRTISHSREHHTPLCGEPGYAAARRGEGSAR